MPEFLFELLAEEIPARMQGRAADELKRQVSEQLGEAGLKFSRAEAYSTPRRVALWIDGLPAQQPHREVEIKGPRVGAPDNVLHAFLKARGLASLDLCEQREVGRNKFWFYVERAAGKPTAEVLAGILPDIVTGLAWPRSMRWGYDRVSWVRPLHNIVAVFDGQLVPFEVDFGSPERPRRIVSRKETYGHRFLGPQAFTVTNFNTYKARLGVRQVVIDPAERMHIIRKHAERLARTEGLRMSPDDALLEEVAGLVEWPVVLMGQIEPAYMDLPPEILITAMRAHQKYFALQDGEGALAPRFLVVSNMVTADQGLAITAGNERVLRARLADAKFFWDQDRKLTLDDRLPALKRMVFHEKLGNLADKSDRVEKLAFEIARQLSRAEEQAVRRAARLAKADLTCGMVGEFPELQGVMGRYYAKLEGEALAVADAIAEHYAPLGPHDRPPTAPVSIAVALADKIDTLVGFWAVKEKPTGSKDPYALRRAALGAIRLIIENELRYALLAMFRVAFESYEAQGLKFDANELRRDLLEFFADRMKALLKEKGVRHDLVAAVFAHKREDGLGEDDLVRLLARVDALAKFLESEDGANLLTASKRAGNILRIEEKKDGRDFKDLPDPSLLRLPEEFNLVESMKEARERAETALKREAFGVAMAALAKLRGPVDDFFDRVTVNAEDRAQRVNRLRLLARIRTTLNTVADFSKIEA